MHIKIIFHNIDSMNMIITFCSKKNDLKKKFTKKIIYQIKFVVIFKLPLSKFAGPNNKILYNKTSSK